MEEYSNAGIEIESRYRSNRGFSVSFCTLSSRDVKDESQNKCVYIGHIKLCIYGVVEEKEWWKNTRK